MAGSCSQRLSDALRSFGGYLGRGWWLARALSGSQTRSEHAAGLGNFRFQNVQNGRNFGNSKHSKRKSRTDFHLLFVGETHTHSSPFRNASAPVSVLCSKLEVNDVIKCVRADEATIFCLVRAVVPGPVWGAALGRFGCVIFLV